MFKAVRELVFAAWVERSHAMHWWGPEGFTNVSCQMDVRPGGSWRRDMRSPDGVIYRKRGVYQEIVAPELLVFTYLDEDEDGVPGPETLVTVTFEPEADGTRLTLRHTRFVSTELRDAHFGGWSSCLERFAAYVAAQK